MLLALRRQTPWIEFEGVPVVRISACGPLGEARAVLELDRFVPLIGHEPGPIGVVLADCVAVLKPRSCSASRYANASTSTADAATR